MTRILALILQLLVTCMTPPAAFATALAPWQALDHIRPLAASEFAREDEFSAADENSTDDRHLNLFRLFSKAYRFTYRQDETGFGLIPPYNRRRQFGAWINADPENDCYDTRTEVLIRDAIQHRVSFSPENRCRVARGVWHDPYTNSDRSNPQTLHIDHVVPLKNAYYSGAWRWDRAHRCHFANFLANPYQLVAVDATENIRKNDRPPNEYLPPSLAYHCDYLRNWMKIKTIWGLEVTVNEVQSVQSTLIRANCNPRQMTIKTSELRRMRAAARQPSEACIRAAGGYSH